jgi:hypothetical protein
VLGLAVVRSDVGMGAVSPRSGGYMFLVWAFDEAFEPASSVYLSRVHGTEYLQMV